MKKLITLTTLFAISAGAMARGGTVSPPAIFDTIKVVIEGISVIVGTIILFWALFQLLVRGKQFQEISTPLFCGLMIGAAGSILSLFPG